MALNMSLNRAVGYFLCLVLITAACNRCQENKPVYKGGDYIRITGVVSMAGNEPFTRIIIRPADRKEAFILPEEFKKDKSHFIGKTLTVSGKVEVKKLISGDHKYTVYEYYLVPENTSPGIKPIE